VAEEGLTVAVKTPVLPRVAGTVFKVIEVVVDVPEFAPTVTVCVSSFMELPLAMLL
jgi:hypothetical protein